VTDDRTTTVPGRRRGVSRLAGNLGLVGAALLASLLVCELLLRLLGISYPVFVWTDPIRGVAHIPGARSLHQSEGESRVEINRDGLRGPEVPLAHPAGTFRIALLGDSFIEAFEVPFDQTVGEVLERRLSALRGTPVEVLNFGVGGYGTTQEELTLRHEVWKYSPDLVLLAVTTGNDIADNYRPLRRMGYVPYYVLQNGGLVLDSSFLQSKEHRSRALWTRRLLGVVQNSRLVQLVNRARHLQRKGERRRELSGGAPENEVGLHTEIYVPPTTPEWQTAWTVTEGILRMMRDECRVKRTPFVIVTLTNGMQVTPVREEKEKFLRRIGAEDLYYPNRRLAEFGQREGIPVFNLAPPMAEQAEQHHVYFHSFGSHLGIGHWNQDGHRVAGELMASWLAGELADGSIAQAQGGQAPVH
jgi:hypothetical protein